MDSPVFSVSDFVAVFNQTISFAYSSVLIEGELEDFRISKNQWVYFSLKDGDSSLRFFGTVYHLKTPLTDGMMLKVRGVPFLHPKYGFSINVQTITPIGEGSLKKAAQLLEAKLRSEGLFDPERKKLLPRPPSVIDLVTSVDSAAYRDFIKVLESRWSGIEIRVLDVKVQGENAALEIVEAVNYFNTHESPGDVIVVTRGGGSIEDLSVFNTELVTRAVALSRTPTLVAIGHERDVSLAELAADKRASTPSNAAEMLTPDKDEHLKMLNASRLELSQIIDKRLVVESGLIAGHHEQLDMSYKSYIERLNEGISSSSKLVKALSPASILERGYAIVKYSGKVIVNGRNLKTNDSLMIEMSDSIISTTVNGIKVKKQRI